MNVFIQKPSGHSLGQLALADPALAVSLDKMNSGGPIQHQPSLWFCEIQQKIREEHAKEKKKRKTYTSVVG